MVSDEKKEFIGKREKIEYESDNRICNSHQVEESILRKRILTDTFVESFSFFYLGNVKVNL